MSGFLSAFLIGIAVAAPVGPVGVLCMQRTLKGGVALGLASGAGVATADALYATLAALGLAAVTAAAQVLQTPLRVVGGVALVALSWRAWRSAEESCEAAPAPSAANLAGAYGTALALTLANPATIMSFAAIMAGLASGALDRGSGMRFVAGIGLGSLAWWTALALVIGYARSRASARVVAWAGRVSAALLGVAGVVVLVSAVRSVL